MIDVTDVADVIDVSYVANVSDSAHLHNINNINNISNISNINPSTITSSMSKFTCSHLLLIIIPFLIFSLCIGCVFSTPDNRLDNIDHILSSNPDSALSALTAIDKGSLDEANRHYYDFLSIKASDKAYIEHKSDSLVLDVIDYYSRHDAQDLYGEALYYGGRVYSDLGDSPTALDYFHQALDATEDDPSKIELRTSIYSQGGRLLGHMKMYDESIIFINKAIQLEKEERPLDTIALYYDLQLLSDIYSFAGKLEESDSVLKQALTYKDIVPNEEICMSLITLANLNRKMGHFDEAWDNLKIARKYLAEHTLNDFLLLECRLLLEKGDRKKAFFKVNEIIQNKDPQQKLSAYSHILSPELIDYLPRDSVSPYLEHYWMLLHKRYDEEDAQMVIFQQSRYNYYKHQRDAINSEKYQKILIFSIAALAFILITGIFYTVVRRIKYKHTLIELKKALDTVVVLRQSQLTLTKQLEDLTADKDSDTVSTIQLLKEKAQTNLTLQKLDSDLRSAMRQQLLQLSKELKEKGTKIPIDTAIIQSPVYKTLTARLAGYSIVKDDDPLWQELSNLVNNVTPGFTEKLEILLGGPLKSNDMQTCLLMKCGFGTTQISALVGRTTNAISTRKSSISNRIFEKEHGSRGIEMIIQLL